MIMNAIALAKKSHEGQFRKWANPQTPYIVHPARVALLVSLMPNVLEEEICAAWLHDVIEDCDVTHNTIMMETNSLVANLVADLTNPSKLYPQLSRIEKKLMDLQHCGGMCGVAKRIKLCDRLDNLRDSTGAPSRWLEKYLDESTRLVDKIGDAYPPYAEAIIVEINKLRIIYHM